MNALSKAQFEFDNRQPVELPDGEAERIWLENATEQLLNKVDIKVKRQGKPVRSVTFEQFAQALDEHGMSKLQDYGVSPSAFGLLLWCAVCNPSGGKEVAENILGVPDATKFFRDIADGLLAPLAADGVIADAEDASS
ncbi:hypothetical protein [Pseudomonas japonica]|uniref:hypothetical protein n=1 Tax=Pseudomonas japonica TaxID=256466 RepID=UPI003A8B6444